MRYKSVLVLFAISAIFVSCKTSCTQYNPNNYKSQDSTIVIYSDSLDHIILNAENVIFYEMDDFIISYDSIETPDSLFKYRVKKNMGELEYDERRILFFIISDKNWYIKNYAPIRQPFHPNIAIEFICKRGTAFMFVSFGTEEVAVSDALGNFKFYQMRGKRLMARWAYMKFPDDEYYIELIKP